MTNLSLSSATLTDFSRQLIQDFFCEADIDLQLELDVYSDVLDELNDVLDELNDDLYDEIELYNYK